MQKRILLMVMFVIAGMVDYGQLAEIKELKEYCTPYYARPATRGKLKKVIVMFRHGDRAPLSAGGGGWEKRKCVACEASKCSLTTCVDGMLTDIGFQQGRNLGKFIKTNYGGILGEGKGINAYCTDVGRTEATLIAALSELGPSAIPYRVEGSLILDSTCASFRNGLAGNVGVKMDYGVFDNYMTSVCGHVPLQCEQDSCRIENASRAVLAQYSNYARLMEELRKDIVVNVSMFADLAGSIVRELGNQANVVLMAAHDSTVSRLLNGLNIQASNVPSYAGAVFIEMLEDKRGSETVRVIYDGAVQKFGLSRSTKIDKQNFVRYLQNFSNNLGLLRKICHDFNSASTNFSGDYRDTILRSLGSGLVRAFNKSNLRCEPLEDGQASNEQSEPTDNDSDDTKVSLPQAVETITKKISHLIAAGWRAGESFLQDWNKTRISLLGAGGTDSGKSCANKKQQIKADSMSVKREGAREEDNRADRLAHLMNMRSDLVEKHSSSRSAGAKKRKGSTSKKKSKREILESTESCSSTTETVSPDSRAEECGKCKKEAPQTNSNNCGQGRPPSCSLPVQCNSQTNNSDNCTSKATPTCDAQQASGFPCDAVNNRGCRKRKSSCRPKRKKTKSCACRAEKTPTAFKCDADAKYTFFPVTSAQPSAPGACNGPRASCASSCPASSPCPQNSIG